MPDPARGGRSYSVFSKRERTRISLVDTLGAPSKNGSQSPPPERRRCPRCRHQWIEGAPDSRLNWPGLAVDYLLEIKVIPLEHESTFRALMEAGVTEGSVGRAAERIGVSRRWLSKTLRHLELPAPGKWTQLACCVSVAELMIHRGMKLAEAGEWLGSDHFNLSERMARCVGLRPSDLGDLPDPIWREVVERWLDAWEACDA